MKYIVTCGCVQAHSCDKLCASLWLLVGAELMVEVQIWLLQMSVVIIALVHMNVMFGLYI